MNTLTRLSTNTTIPNKIYGHHESIDIKRNQKGNEKNVANAYTPVKCLASALPTQSPYYSQQINETREEHARVHEHIYQQIVVLDWQDGRVLAHRPRIYYFWVIFILEIRVIPKKSPYKHNANYGDDSVCDHNAIIHAGSHPLRLKWVC